MVSRALTGREKVAVVRAGWEDVCVESGAAYPVFRVLGAPRVNAGHFRCNYLYARRIESLHIMPPRKKAIAVRLPREIIGFSNLDKPATEHWDERRAGDLGNFPHPARVLMLGPPNCGKTCLTLNLIIHQKPRFAEVYVIHEDSGATRDYEPLDPTAMLPDCPSLEFWNALPDRDKDGKRIKRAVVVDDLEHTTAISSERRI